MDNTIITTYPMQASNLTNEEFYSLNGYLTPERIEKLLVLDEHLEGCDLECVKAGIEEAKSVIKGEDYYSGILKDIIKIIAGLSKNNRALEPLTQLKIDLEDAVDADTNSKAYATEKLKEAISNIENCY